MEWQEFEREAAASSWAWTELPASRSLAASYAALNAHASASPEELHATYRALLRLHHPDRALPENRPSAEDSTKRITAAYRTILEHRRAEQP